MAQEDEVYDRKGDDDREPRRKNSRDGSPAPRDESPRRGRDQDRSRSREPRDKSGGGGGESTGLACRWNSRGFGFIKP